MLARSTVPSLIVTGTFCCSSTPYRAGSGDQASAVPLNSAIDATTSSAAPIATFKTPCFLIRAPVRDRRNLAAERPHVTKAPPSGAADHRHEGAAVRRRRPSLNPCQGWNVFVPDENTTRQ